MGTRALKRWAWREGGERELWSEMEKERQRQSGVQDQQARGDFLVFAAIFWRRGPF